MKNDKLFRNSIIFANLALFAILCYTAFLDAATATGQVVIYTGVMLTAEDAPIMQAEETKVATETEEELMPEHEKKRGIFSRIFGGR